MGWDLAERNVFVTGMKSGQEALYFQNLSEPGVQLLEGLKGNAGIRVEDEG